MSHRRLVQERTNEKTRERAYSSCPVPYFSRLQRSFEKRFLCSLHLLAKKASSSIRSPVSPFHLHSKLRWRFTRCEKPWKTGRDCIWFIYLSEWWSKKQVCTVFDYIARRSKSYEGNVLTRNVSYAWERTGTISWWKQVSFSLCATRFSFFSLLSFAVPHRSHQRYRDRSVPFDHRSSRWQWRCDSSFPLSLSLSLALRVAAKTISHQRVWWLLSRTANT